MYVTILQRIFPVYFCVLLHVKRSSYSHLNNNYVAVYKKMGAWSSVVVKVLRY